MMSVSHSSMGSSGALQPARLSLDEDGLTVELAHGEDGVSPGQACVFYAANGGEPLMLSYGPLRINGDVQDRCHSFQPGSVCGPIDRCSVAQLASG